MAFPKRNEIEISLLQVLADSGGSAQPRESYPQVAASFPDLTAAEQEQRMEKRPTDHKWWHLVRWVRQNLVGAGEIDEPTQGVWTLTPEGASRPPKS